MVSNKMGSSTLNTGSSSSTIKGPSTTSDKKGSSNYTVDMIIGNGTFGVVYLATVAETN